MSSRRFCIRFSRNFDMEMQIRQGRAPLQRTPRMEDARPNSAALDRGVGVQGDRSYLPLFFSYAISAATGRTQIVMMLEGGSKIELLSISNDRF